MLIVEGVKQALAADAWAPPEYSIYRICGITGWSRNGVAPKHLKVVRSHDVVIIPDADAATNPRVYDGAVKLGQACEERRAKSVKFVRITGAGNTGLDDRLGELGDDDEERRELFVDWLAAVKPKPADKRPNRGPRKAAASSTGRPLISVDGDRHVVINKLHAVLHERFNGTELFRHGQTLGQLVVERDGPVVEALTRGAFNDLVSTAAQTGTDGPKEDFSHKWPDANVMEAVTSRFRRYEPLDGVSAVPVVRTDGSIVTATGYDPETKLYISLSKDIEGLEVPEQPSDEQIDAARNLLLDDLLVDFPFKEEADRAHAVAAFITPLIRTLVPTAPLCVINGLQPGIGKGYLLDALVFTVSGGSPELTNLPVDDEVGARKMLTAMLLSGQTLFLFDEMHEIDSAQLALALTAAVWSDRELGHSRQVRLKNTACMYSAGNNVQVLNDLQRRYYSIRLHTNEPNPENRSDFKHSFPDWPREHRRELLLACLTLVRAWFDRGRPKAPDKPFTFGSFEAWQDMVGGILHTAGIKGFLESMRHERSSSDFADQEWTAHLAWLFDTFGDKTFTAKVASAKLQEDDDAEPPHGLARLIRESDPRALGKAWAKHGERWRGGLRIVQDGKGQAGRTKWRIEAYDDACQGGSTPPPPLSDPATACITPKAVAPDRPMPVITDLDDEVA